MKLIAHWCSVTLDKFFPLMAEKTRYLKENPKGVSEVCKQMEDLRNESILEGIDIGDLRTTVKYYKKGKITLEEAAEDLNMTVEEFKEKMNQIPAEAV